MRWAWKMILMRKKMRFDVTSASIVSRDTIEVMKPVAPVLVSRAVANLCPASPLLSIHNATP